MYVTPEFVGGIVKDDSPYSQKGRWTDGDKVRPVRGRWQPLGGCELFSTTAFSGYCRGLHAWVDENLTKYLAFGTHTHLYVNVGGAHYDITPAEAQADTTAVDKLATTNGSATVTVNITAHKQVVGNTIQLWNVTSVGGIIPDGAYTVVSVVDANNYTITHSSAATSTVAAGGGTFNYRHFRSTLSNPFDTTNASPAVTVNHTAHGRAAGDRVIFDAASAGGGITINGEYTVTSVTSANAYVITHSAAATSTASGTGGTVGHIYLLVVGRQDGIGTAGYGTGTYGSGGYGTSTAVANAYPRTWTFGSWGRDLVANPRGQRIFWWARDTALRAVPLPNAPTQVGSIQVTNEKILHAIGCHDGTRYEPMLDKWCDIEDFYDWTAAATNKAGDKPLTLGAQLIRAIGTTNQDLIFSDVALYSRVYTADDQVYAFQKAGENCGLIGPLAVAEHDGRTYWMGRNKQFFVYDGGSARVLECPNLRHVFDAIPVNQQEKIVAHTNTATGDVIWLYPDSTNEIAKYIGLHTQSGAWFTGTWTRTSWIDAGVFPYPIAAGTDGYLYYHEKGASLNGNPMTTSIKSAPIDLDDGNKTINLFSVAPDIEDLTGQVSLTIYTRDLPNSAETTWGPYTIDADTESIDFRISGRQVAIEYSSASDNVFYRLGATRFDYRPGGGR